MPPPQSMKTLATVLLALAFATSASGDEVATTAWFEAGIAGYESWPEDGGEKTIPGTGVWSGTADVQLGGVAGARRLVFDTDSVGVCLALADERDIATDAPPSITASASITISDELPEETDNTKGGLAACLDGGSVYWFACVG